MEKEVLEGKKKDPKFDLLGWKVDGKMGGVKG